MYEKRVQFLAGEAGVSIKPGVRRGEAEQNPRSDLMIFGDGPDGGREAIFDGSVKYPAGKKSWRGYGIVQAKFRQQLDSQAKKNADTTVKQEEFRRWLGGYPWILVLDGLDEVPASSNRQQVMQAIRDFISVEAHGADADLLVLATTRPQGYSDEFDPSFYRHLSLRPLNAEEALDYGLRLAVARHPAQPRDCVAGQTGRAPADFKRIAGSC